MKILVTGQGGREHALVRALSKSPSVKEVHAIPGSDGMSLDAKCHRLEVTAANVIQLVETLGIELVVVGPETHIEQGLSDQLRARNIRVFGPSQKAGCLESSKIVAKEFMRDAAIPTSHFQIVRSAAEISSVIDQFTPPYVLKADGLAAGKGVVICSDHESLMKAANDFFVKKIHGGSAERALLEQFTPGVEISYLILTTGVSAVTLPLSQDHKKLLSGEKGPNTGGMGTVAPVELGSEIRAQIEARVVGPALKLLNEKQKSDAEFLYRGVLYIGLMLTADGPSVIEFNARFGDPECQVIMPLLDGDWAEVLGAIADGKVPNTKWYSDRSAACVVLAAEGYPEQPQKNIPIPTLNQFGQVAEGSANSSAQLAGSGLKPANGPALEESYLLHAGTLLTSTENSQWQSSGGRVLNAVGCARSVKEALRQAYGLVAKAKAPGLIYRNDIGEKIPEP
jgi:phosphoribosylamine---glycine ligase